uniref:Putative membrane protein n=1 Tax=Xenopsylla cheopis TaxID=163159 RepID=A0A6M2DSB6_XENCH
MICLQSNLCLYCWCCCSTSLLQVLVCLLYICTHQCICVVYMYICVRVVFYVCLNVCVCIFVCLYISCVC